MRVAFLFDIFYFPELDRKLKYDWSSSLAQHAYTFAKLLST